MVWPGPSNSCCPMVPIMMGYALELGSKLKPLFKKKRKTKISQSPVQSVVTDMLAQLLE